MRQAGRYLEEYRAIRKEHSFLEMCTSPDLIVEVTLQPVRRFDLDAAIIFSDILLPLLPLGIPLDYVEGTGPVMKEPVRTREAVERLRNIDPEREMAYLLEAIGRVKAELSGTVPLLGFCGAPFTLASYLIEGGGSRNYILTKRFMYQEPGTFLLLVEKLADLAASVINAEIRHGAQAIQVFDSWVGALSPSDYAAFVLPGTRRLFSQLDRSVPHIHFGVNAGHLLTAMVQAGGDVIGVDWRMALDDAWRAVGERAVQGNLDPVALFGPPEYLASQVDRILDSVRGRPGHIFNLGHGILPETPPEAVTRLVRLVHERSRR